MTPEKLRSMITELEADIALLHLIRKSKDHLMIDISGKGVGFAFALESAGIKIDRVWPSDKGTRFRLIEDGL